MTVIQLAPALRTIAHALRARPLGMPDRNI